MTYCPHWSFLKQLVNGDFIRFTYMDIAAGVHEAAGFYLSHTDEMIAVEVNDEILIYGLGEIVSIVGGKVSPDNMYGELLNMEDQNE